MLFSFRHGNTYIEVNICLAIYIYIYVSGQCIYSLLVVRELFGGNSLGDCRCLRFRHGDSRSTAKMLARPAASGSSAMERICSYNFG